MDEETLEYLEHFTMLNALQKMEIIHEFLTNAMATGVQENERMGLRQVTSQVATNIERIRRNLT